MAHTLEARVPFSDKRYVNFCMNLNPKLKFAKFHKGIEKYIIRKAFDCEEDPYLPADCLWRTKECFSDGVGGIWKKMH